MSDGRRGRREVLAGLAASLAWAACAPAPKKARRARAGADPEVPVEPQTERVARPIDVIEAPNNLGLRPPRPGVEPGAWRAPEVLERAGLSRRLGASRRVGIARRAYQVDAQPGTRIRNGVSLREMSLELAGEVDASLARGAMPVVVGGDCSNLFGCMLGLRRAGGRGLVHLDGHSDFFHPGNYDAKTRLGSAAGMDLALATGRGEPILTRWPGVDGPLVADADVVQMGERDSGAADYPFRDYEATVIERIRIERMAGAGLDGATAAALAHLGGRAIERAWLHVDLDVLDAAVMPAVDAPGSPGLGFEELSRVVAALLISGRIAGLDVAIYDPDLDPDGRHAASIVDAIAAGLAPVRGARGAS